METRLLRVHVSNAHDPAIREAARLLRAGQIVAFPTETVYGLGANALDPRAVAEIFHAKGRPSHNPLIVHVDSVNGARELTVEWSVEAEKMAAAFWPGPLTIVVKKGTLVPPIVTAGGDTVAVRCPAHGVARALIAECGFPLAAPSANRSNFLSPTTAAHVMRSLAGRIPLVLDGGHCQAGIESTVVRFEHGECIILRPGSIGGEMIEGLAGIPVREGVKIPEPAGRAGAGGAEILQSPGQLSVHYAPQTPLLLVQSKNLDAVLNQLKQDGKRAGLMAIGSAAQDHPVAHLVKLPESPIEYAAGLYSALHELDEMQLDVLVCELPPDSPGWDGVNDRLRRAGRLTSAE